MLSECVSDTSLVHDIRILVSEIDDNDVRPEDQVKNVLNDRTFFPNVITSKTPIAYNCAGALDASVNDIECRIEWHHYRNQIRLDCSVLRNLEDVRRKCNLAFRWLCRDVLRFIGIFLRDVALKYIQRLCVLLTYPSDDRKDISCVVFITPVQASEKPWMIPDRVGMAGEQPNLLPIVRVEVTHHLATQINDTFTKLIIDHDEPASLIGA